MNRSRIAFFLLSALVVFPLLAATLLRAAESKTTPDQDSFYKYLSVFSETLGLIRQAYVDKPDMDALMAGALDGTTDALDPFSVYVPSAQVASYVKTSSVGPRYSGLTLLKERGVAYVVSVEKGSPAAAAGVRAGDIVAKIDGRSTRLMPVWEIQELVTAKPGTKVGFEVIRLGAPVQLAFELKEFAAPPVALEAVKGVSVLHIPDFDEGTAAAVKKALASAAGSAAEPGTGAPNAAGAPNASGKGRLLIDLRGVCSGAPEAAYATADLFAAGDLGVLKRRAEELQAFNGAAPPVWQGKIVLLVDRGTLGAAEVFATVLRQKVKAELVGERTFGHAGRLGTTALSTGGQLVFTEAFYTGPDKAPIREGLKPDLVVDERSRTYLEKDLPMEQIILDRGVRRLLGEELKVEAKAA
jgi:carboxyl-terminal processing protease